jgi:hypothetical protein
MKQRNNSHGADEAMVALASTLWFCLGLLEAYGKLSDEPFFQAPKLPPVRKRRIK